MDKKGLFVDHYYDDDASFGDVASSVGDASSHEGDQSIFQLENTGLETLGFAAVAALR